MDPYYSHFVVRDAINAGKVQGPRIVAAGHLISITGGHGDFNSGAPELNIPAFGEIVDGVDEVRKAVRKEVKWGADWIKIAATGGIYTAGDNPGLPQFTFEEMKAAVDEARRFNRFVAAHSHGVEGTKAAIRAGVRSIEHGSVLDDEAIELFKRHGAYLVPTIYSSEFTLAEGEKYKQPAHAMEKARALHEMKRHSFLLERLRAASRWLMEQTPALLRKERTLASSQSWLNGECRFASDSFGNFSCCGDARSPEERGHC